MVLQKNKLFCLAEQFGINHWILHKNKREQNGLTRSILHKNKKRADWYKSLNPEEKEKLLSGRAKWYKTLDPADKDKIISQVQANNEAPRNSVQRDLVYQSDTRSVTTLDPKDPLPSRYPSYLAHGV